MTDGRWKADGQELAAKRSLADPLAISAGANVKAIQRMLGDASAAMTLDTYAELFDDDLDDVASALDRALVAAPNVLSGTMRLRLGPHDIRLGPGEVAEFPTEQPHWFGSTGVGQVEVLSLFGTQGEMMHVRAHTRRKEAGEKSNAEAHGCDCDEVDRNVTPPRAADPRT